ncbi:MAG: excinuclease ABC subunit UvrC [candidate division WOR-3 bacterium]
MIDYKNLPDETGVYIFKDKNGNILYIGKASSIKNRVKQYLLEQDKRVQVPFILSEAEKVEYILTKDQKNALFLEFKLINKFKPKYNVKLKDSNSYPYIKISGDKYPVLSLTYKIDDGTFFGPFSKVSYVKTIIETLNKIFLLKRCNQKNPKKICIEYQIGNCGGVCQFEEEKNIYKQKIKKVEEILNGGTKELIKFLKSYMEELVQKEEFEKAAFVRDSIEFIKKEIKKGKRLTFKYQNRDIVSFSFDKRNGSFSVLKIRENYISDIITKTFVFNEKMPKDEICKEILLKYYISTSDFDFSTLVIDFNFLDESFIEFFKEKGINVVKLEKSLIDQEPYRIARENSDNELYKFIKKEFVPSSIIELKKNLNLKEIPKNIVGVDISHFSGDWNSGSVVFFEYGKPKKSFYRYYNLDEIGNDDYLSIKEIFKRYLEKYDVNLAIIDGGIGQLMIAKQVLNELNKDIDLISVAKKTNTIFFPEGKNVQLDIRSGSFYIIKKVIDEAHRFANKLRKIKMKNKIGVKKNAKRNNS